MATAATGVEPKETECAVCHGDFIDPKILLCAHLLCRDCLVTWLKADDGNQCPLCRCAIVDSAQLAAKSCEDIADALPTDLAMAALVESVDILNKDHICCACPNVAAAGICLHCGDMLCSSCVTIHSKFSSTHHHKVESLTSLTPERLSASRPAPCSAHSDRPSELFCPTHGVSVCLLCATADHRSCPEVTKLESTVKEARAVLDKLLAKLTKGEKVLERAIGQLDQNLADVDKNTQAAMAEIDAAYHRLETSLQAWRHRVKELIKGANSDAKAVVQGGKAVLLERRGKLTSHRRLAQRVKQTTPPSSMCEMKSKLQVRVTDLDYSATLPEDVKRAIVKKLTLDPPALTRIEKELATLGQLEGGSVSVERATPRAKYIPRPLTLQGSNTGALQYKPHAVLDFRFHACHGQNIVLSDQQRTAERVRGRAHGVVLSSDPMVIDALYEVQLVQVHNTSFYSSVFYTGVTSDDPACLTLTRLAPDWNSAHVIRSHHVRSYGQQVKTNIGKVLWKLPERSRVGVSVDGVGCLHLYLDRRDLGVAVRGVKLPCYAFFALEYEFKKIKALPVTYTK